MRQIGDLAREVVQTVPAEASPHSPSHMRVKQPRLLDKTADFEIPQRVWSNWIPAVGKREVVRALRADEYTAIKKRVQELIDGMHPFTLAEVATVKASIAAMLGGYRAMRNLTEENAHGAVEILCAVLRDFPAWVIGEACKNISRNAADTSNKFAPNDAEIASVCREVMAPYVKALRQANDLLNAPVEMGKSDDVRR